MTTQTKRCSRCERNFPATLEYFYAEKRHGPGALRSTCKACTNAQNKETRDPDKLREYGRKWAEENRDSRRKSVREWRARNLQEQRTREKKVKQADPERLTKSAKWKKDNPEKTRQQRKAYEQKNRYKLNEITRRYFSRKANRPDNFTEKDWQFALDHFGGCCAVCCRPPGLFHTLAMDHWIPISSSHCPGTIPANMIPLCHGINGCNNSKHNRDPESWLIAKYGKKRGCAILSKIHRFFSLVRQVD